MTMKDFKALTSELNTDRILGSLGLETKPSVTSEILGATGLFALGAVVGAAIALLAAPKAGSELRGDLRDKISRVKDRSRQDLEDLHQ